MCDLWEKKGGLELWSKSHPPGQRVSDLLEWAKDFLEAEKAQSQGSFTTTKVGGRYVEKGGSKMSASRAREFLELLKFRVVKLPELKVYRVEWWNNTRFWGKARWEPLQDEFAALIGGNTTFKVKEDACAFMKEAELKRDRMIGEELNLWQEVECDCKGSRSSD